MYYPECNQVYTRVHMFTHSSFSYTWVVIIQPPAHITTSSSLYNLLRKPFVAAARCYLEVHLVGTQTVRHWRRCRQTTGVGIQLIPLKPLKTAPSANRLGVRPLGCFVCVHHIIVCTINTPNQHGVLFFFFSSTIQTALKTFIYNAV